MSESTNRGQWRVALERLPPFVLSLAKDAGCASSHACVDKLSTNRSSPPDHFLPFSREIEWQETARSFIVGVERSCCEPD